MQCFCYSIETKNDIIIICPHECAVKVRNYSEYTVKHRYERYQNPNLFEYNIDKRPAFVYVLSDCKCSSRN